MDQGGLACRNVEAVTACPAPAPVVVGCFAHPGHACGAAAGPAPRGKGRAALFWSLGGTVLSGVGFIALALFEQYNSSLAELRGDLKHFNETSGEFVKQESLRRTRDQVKECLHEMHASSLARAQLEQELRASEKARDELAKEMQRLRERLATVEGRQAATPVVIPAARAERP